MGSGPEAGFQRQVIQLAHTFGWLVQHTRPAKQGDRWLTPIAGDAGFPDLVLVHPERGIIYAELKSDKGAVSDAQHKWGRAIRDAGGEWRLWRPKDLDDIVLRLQRRWRKEA